MEITREKSQELADIINAIKLPLHLIDTDYARAVASGLRDQASRQEAMAVLNPSYDPKRNELLRLQAKALDHLAGFIETLKACDQVKAEIEVGKEHQARIDSLFL